MIWQILKKQGLILLRNPVQLLLLVGLPVILIAILGTALGGTMNGGSSPLDMKVAFVEHGDEQQQVERFMDDIESKLPTEAVEDIQDSAGGLLPISTLKDDLFGSAGDNDMIDVHDAKSSEVETLKNDDSFTAVIEVPENFTYDMLEYMVLDKPVQPELQIHQNETQEMGVSVVTSILKEYQEQFTISTFVSKNDLNPDVLNLSNDTAAGEITTVNQKNPVSAKGYYSVGMVVMNVLFLASTIGSIAFHEKKTHVFDRIIIGDVSRWKYFTGILLSGVFFGFFHLLIVYGFAWLVFGVVWPDPGAFLTVSAAYAVSIGGITVLLTAISYRINSELITNFFSGILVIIMAFLGGSFFPIGETSLFFRTIGNFTPNGAGMSAYIGILRGDGLPEIWHHLLFLVVFALAAIVLAAVSFPKRGGSA